MTNLANDTAVQKVDDQRYRAVLSDRWEIWGPNGGYVAAIALRAVGEEARGLSPVSFYCQYLNIAEFGEVQISITCVKSGRSAKAFDAIMSQGEKTILKALVWTATEGDGLSHNHIELPPTWVPLEQAPDTAPNWGYEFWRNFNVRPLQPDFTPDRKANGGVSANWYQFVPEFGSQDSYLDAARSVILIDTLQWPAAVLAHDEGQVRHMAPSLDLSVHFHNRGVNSPWLFCEATSDYAAHGLISGAARTWDLEGKLLASGGSQLICRPLIKR